MRSAKNSPHLQNRIRDSFGSRSRRADIPVRGEVFLLNLDPRRSCHEEHQDSAAWLYCCAYVGHSSLGVTQNRNLECLRHDLCSVPITVKKALERVPGVSSVDVRFEKKQVLVTFDDAKTSTDALVKATTNAGYPSQPEKVAK